jgi:Polyketide cyclase / dehydrase and lipid transport
MWTSQRAILVRTKYRITAAAEFNAAAGKVWELLSNWERLVAVGLPGMTSEFEWLSGGPGHVPSTFQFAIAGATLKEEIYERTTDEGGDRYLVRYRALEPALGVVEYDAVLELRRLTPERTAFEAVREVRLEPGTTPEMLAEMVRSETQCLKEHFED